MKPENFSPPCIPSPRLLVQFLILSISKQFSLPVRPKFAGAERVINVATLSKLSVRKSLLAVLESGFVKVLVC